MQGVPGGLDFDAVVSNPPYIPTSELGGLQPEVRDHDPRLALDGGADGLTFYRRLASEVPPVLRDGGRLLVELGDEIRAGQPAARIHFHHTPWRAPETLAFRRDGLVLCKRVPARCERGDCLFHLATDVAAA